VNSHALLRTNYGWGAMAMDLGAFTPFFYAFREREMITEIMEDTCGARLTMNYIVPGGVMYDLHPDFQEKVKICKTVQNKVTNTKTS
jgi:NADH:ubiquinone oxidoreductase subunit D